MISRLKVIRMAIVLFFVALLCVSVNLPGTSPNSAPLPENEEERKVEIRRENRGRRTIKSDLPSTLYLMAKEVFDELPDRFLPGFKSPCWIQKDAAYQSYDDMGRVDQLPNLSRDVSNSDWSRDVNQTRLQCLPYFYILGMPKCGTTDLWYRVLQHPDVFEDYGLDKEPHWWTRERHRNVPFLSYLSRVSNMTDILQTNSSLRGRLIYGDGSASTLWDTRWSKSKLRKVSKIQEEKPYTTANLLRAVQPDAKFLVILRDPVARLYSDYLYFARKSRSPLHFHDSVVKSLDVHSECIRDRSMRACAYEQGHSFSMRLNIGLYAIFLLDWFQVFPRDQFLVLNLEDWHSNCCRVLAKIYDFLELEPLSEDKIIRICQPRPKNSNILKLRSVGPMLRATRTLLEDFYSDPNRQLRELLGSNFLWEYEKKMIEKRLGAETLQETDS